MLARMWSKYTYKFLKNPFLINGDNSNLPLDEVKSKKLTLLFLSNALVKWS